MAQNQKLFEKEAEYFDYMVQMRRHLHQYPEVGFDLPETAKTVAGELEKMGIRWTADYGQCSVVGEIGSGSKLIALRADMDALPVEEKTGLPYASKIKGRMHACGHDAHTAIMLAVAKFLKEREADLGCRVRFIFQPAEETAASGAKMMLDNGVMEGVESVLCTHCDNGVPAGTIGVCSGDYMAACVPMHITFLGATAHAAMPEKGIDAIAMAHKAYGLLKEKVVQLAGNARYIWSVGRFSGGTAHNVVADRCDMEISFRFFDMDFARQMKEATFEICQQVAQEIGGSVEIDWNMSVGPVCNAPETVEKVAGIATEQGLPLMQMQPRMSSEDFGWYLTQAKGMLFRFGTRNEELGCTTLAHCNDFRLDEAGMLSAFKVFAAYALEYGKPE